MSTKRFLPNVPVFKGISFQSKQRFLSDLLEVEPESRPLPQQAASDLRVWAQAAMSAANGLPIPHRQPIPSLAALTCVSDAGRGLHQGEWEVYTIRRTK